MMEIQDLTEQGQVKRSYRAWSSYILFHIVDTELVTLPSIEIKLNDGNVIEF